MSYSSAASSVLVMRVARCSRMRRLVRLDAALDTGPGTAPTDLPHSGKCLRYSSILKFFCTKWSIASSTEIRSLNASIWVAIDVGSFPHSPRASITETVGAYADPHVV